MVGTEAPEKLIFRRVAVGHSSVIQVSDGVKTTTKRVRVYGKSAKNT